MKTLIAVLIVLLGTPARGGAGDEAAQFDQVGGISALLRAAAAGKIDLVKTLREQTQAVNTKNKADIQWVTIEGGTFLMGSGKSADTKPTHSVTVPTFQLARTEVTAGQYKKCVLAGACEKPEFDSQSDEHPVVGVDWEQARKFSEWAGGRLPTEAEWEYAARSGGKEKEYPWGVEAPTCETAVVESCGDKAAPVCSKPAGNTKQGLCDMIGNVREWTQDDRHDSYEGAPTDGSAWEDAAPDDPSKPRARIARGGDWESYSGFEYAPGAARATSRSGNSLQWVLRLVKLGFRPARGGRPAEALKKTIPAIQAAEKPASAAAREGYTGDMAPVWRNTDPAASGFYAKEEEITFNVLDKVSIDPKTGKITLIGHHDDAYGGPKIPYFQHLATLLEYPQPEFSLHWTPESAERVQAFMDRQLSKEELDRAIEQWGVWFDEGGKITAAGRYMLPVFGIRPTDNGKRPGHLGIRLRLGENNIFEITSVEPGSPAARAGLAVGDTIGEDFSAPLYTPKEFYRWIRAAGAGAEFKRSVYSGGGWKEIAITLDADPGDIWEGFEPRDVIEQVMRADGNEQGAQAAHAMGVVFNMDESVPRDVFDLAYNNFMMKVVPDFRAYMELDAQRRNGRITREEHNTQVQRWMCAGYEKAFRIPAGTFTRPFEEALAQGLTSEAAGARTFGLVNGKLTRLTKELTKILTAWWDRQWERPEGIQIAPELVEQALGIHPEMAPEYINVDSRSQLARLMYEADYLGKRLINSPALRANIPEYMTEFAFYRAHPEKEQNTNATVSYHMWASLVGVELARSKDGLILRTGKAKMRFNIRQFGPGRKDLPPVPGGYEELLTAHYDDFARVYPALHELREAAKLSAAAHWIRTRSDSFKLPGEGRSEWSGPAKIPGLVYRYYHPGGDGSSHMTTIAAGGISLLPLEPFPRGNADIRIATDEELGDSPDPETVQRLELPTIEGVPVGAPTTGQPAGRVNTGNEAGKSATPDSGTESDGRGLNHPRPKPPSHRLTPVQHRNPPAGPASGGSPAPVTLTPSPATSIPVPSAATPQPYPQPGANVEASSGPIHLPQIPCDPNAAPAAPGRETQLLCITMTCGGTDRAGVCCPGGYPYLNLDDCLCYRDRTAITGKQYSACQYFRPR